MKIPMDSTSKKKAFAAFGLAALIFGPVLLLGGCMMTPEDKAFYGRGWINPDELDQEAPPPRSFTDPTSVPPHMMGPGEY